MRCLLKCLVFALLGPLVLRSQIYPQTIVLNRDSYKHYIDSFNANDQELYPQFISNRQCWSFLSENIPFLDSPDKMMEQTYYFRWCDGHWLTVLYDKTGRKYKKGKGFFIFIDGKKAAAYPELQKISLTLNQPA